MSDKQKGVAYMLAALKALASERNLKVFFALQSGRKRWSDLMFDMKLNPQSLSLSLKKLQKTGLVKKLEYDKGYEITKFGAKVNEVIHELLKIYNTFSFG